MPPRPFTPPRATSTIRWSSSTACSGREEQGPSYARYDNPTVSALQDLVNELEGGHATLACSSGMMALHLAVLAALVDRPKRVVAGHVLYGATTHMLMTVFGALGVETTFVDACDLGGVRGRGRRNQAGGGGGRDHHQSDVARVRAGQNRRDRARARTRR